MAFTNRTFELLAELENDGKYSFYQENRADFQKHLVSPFHELILEGIVPQLVDEIADSMKTQSRIFGQINKNDFGKGGANPFYWAAFYPNRSENKQQDVQLLTFINHKYIEFGFFFGRQCPIEKCQQFSTNIRQLCNSKPDYESAIEFLSECFPEDTLLVRGPDYDINGEEIIGHVFTWRDYFDLAKDEPAENIPTYSPMLVHSRETVLSMTDQELAAEISATFAGIFPLVILATYSDPLPALRSYIES